MTGWAWGALGFVGALFTATLGDLVSEEVRGWLDLAPRVILRLAAARLNPGQRESVYEAEWLPELCYVLRGAEARPITRLIRGIAFAVGLLIAARRIARHISRVPRTQSARGGRAPLPRQVGLAAVTVPLEGLACYFAAIGLADTQAMTVIWAGWFLAIMCGGQVALHRYRQRHQRGMQLLTTILLGVFVTLLGVLRYSFLVTTGVGGLAAALTGACLFTATTAGFLFLGYLALRAAETPQEWRVRRLAHAASATPLPTSIARQTRRPLAVYSMLAARALLALLPVPLEGLACYFTATALGGNLDVTIIWAGLFLAAICGGQAAICFYREGHDRVKRPLVILLGIFVTLLGILRYSDLADVGDGRWALTGACLFTATTVGSVLVGYIALRAAGPSQSWFWRATVTGSADRLTLGKFNCAPAITALPAAEPPGHLRG